MDKTLYNRYIENFSVNLLDCKFLGKGHNGIIYMLPEDKVIKICFNPESCKREYDILEKVNGNKYFPKVYGMSGNYMIRDYIDGIPLNKYIKRFGLSKELSLNLIDLLEEFKKLKFSKLDLRCKDVIVKPDETVMVIDPKKFYSKNRDFPRHLTKGLYKLHVLKFFMKAVKEERPDLFNQWNKKIDSYIKVIKRKAHK